MLGFDKKSFSALFYKKIPLWIQFGISKFRECTLTFDFFYHEKNKLSCKNVFWMFSVKPRQLLHPTTDKTFDRNEGH